MHQRRRNNRFPLYYNKIKHFNLNNLNMLRFWSNKIYCNYFLTLALTYVLLWPYRLAQCFSLYQDVTHGLDMFVSVVWGVRSLVSTGVGPVLMPSCTEPDPGVTRNALIFLIGHVSNSCFGKVNVITHGIKTFPVAVELERGLRTDQRLPCVTSQWSGAVFTIWNQGVQRASRFVQNKESGFFSRDLHAKADLCKRCVPVGWQLGLILIQTCLPFRDAVRILVSPERWIVDKRLL